ncbi:MAG: ATP cone domain-containing protein [Ktedonobacterales bacterium]
MSHATLVSAPTTVFKRDGRDEPFDISRIERAIALCYVDINKVPRVHPRILATRAIEKLHGQRVVMVEAVQDAVVQVLADLGDTAARKHYVEYRAERERERNERPIPVEVQESFARSAVYFPTPIQQFQFYDKYSRFDHELGRRETWEETVDRAVNFLWELTVPHGQPLSSATWDRLRRGILNMEVMPSMRLLAMAGPAARRNHISVYNCTYQAIEDIRCFPEALLISMSGTGVGYSVESQYVEKLPRVQRQRHATKNHLVIEDSTEGWYHALLNGLEHWFSGYDITFDYSQIRPAGSILRTKGGRASGPDPLREMLDSVRKIILARQGNVLRSIDAHDIMCHVGNAAVQGGVRRTAMISLFDWDDNLMLHAKDGDLVAAGNTQRWNANNSVVWPEHGITQNDLMRQMLAMDTSQNGEPGIFNRTAMWNTTPERRKALGYQAFGTNPCAEINLRNMEMCVSSDTLLITRDGVTPIIDSVGKEIEVWNGKRWSKVSPTKTGSDRKLYRVRFGDGSCLDVTGYHRFSVSKPDSRFRGKGWEVKTTLELKDTIHQRWSTEPFQIEHNGGHFVPPQDAYELGFAIGDGHIKNGRVHAALYGKKATHLPLRGERGTTRRQNGYNVDMTPIVFTSDLVTPQRVVAMREDATTLHEVFTWSRDAILSFVAGMADADGSETGTGGIRLYVSDFERARRMQLLLTKCGIRSSVNLLHRAGTKTNFGTRSKDLWYLQITDCADIPCHRLNTSHGHQPTMKGKYQMIVSIEELPGLHDTYCFEETEEHKGVFGNSLTYQCNLSICVARPWDTPETLAEKVELATIIGTIQSLATDFPLLRPQWKQNCEEERLLGVDITGQMDSPVTRQALVLDDLRHHAVETNAKYADLLSVNQSAAVTCVKPSGNSSQLLGCSSGLHARHARYYVRNIRVSNDSPMHKVLRSAGVPMSPENGQTFDAANTWVIHFPVKAPDGAVTRDQMSAIDQCEVWLRNKVYWTEHNASVTISYGPDELIPLTQWLWDHRDMVGGMSFLPRFDARYDNMPYEEITAAEYEKLAAEFPKIDFEKLYRYEESDQTTASSELACFAGQCEIEQVPTGEGK